MTSLLSRSTFPPSTEVTSARVLETSGLASAVVTVQPSSSQSAQVPMVSAPDAVASSVPSGLHSPSTVGPSSVRPLPLHGDTVPKEIQDPMYLIREQRDAAKCPGSSRIPDPGNVLNDPAGSSATVNGRRPTVTRPRSEKSQLQWKVSRFMSEIGSSRAIRNTRDVSQQHLPDRDAEIDRLKNILASVLELLDG